MMFGDVIHQIKSNKQERIDNNKEEQYE